MVKQEHISKKIWQKPELKVICRGESEENVLASCKGMGSWLGSGPFGIVTCGQGGEWFCNASTNS
ncbi:MAG: hypothetical protein GY699_17895 [Desulfobacteraceae bacterium]|nr:hypothetical protein [Desulfobacteraceae bacterium]